MVHLAFTAQGLAEALAKAKVDNQPVWCSADAISEQEFKEGRIPGLTRFDHPLPVNDSEALADALATINEHHPGEAVSIEGRRQP